MSELVIQNRARRGIREWGKMGEGQLLCGLSFASHFKKDHNRCVTSMNVGAGTVI